MCVRILSKLYCRCPIITNISTNTRFLSTYSRMYTGKILSLVRKAAGCFEFNWE